MSRKVLGAALTLLVTTAVPGPVEAWPGNRPWFSTGYYYYPSYYYPAYYSRPVVRYYYAPAPVYVEAVPICIGPVSPPNPVAVNVVPYAQPKPAPASESGEPPLPKTGLGPPKVSESRSFTIGDAKAAPPAAGKDQTVCQVGFWNITGRDVRVTVDGTAHTVPRDRSITLTLNREFSWQMEGQAPHKERVPDDKGTHEIVIR
jgi:hypothetical protein